MRLPDEALFCTYLLDEFLNKHGALQDSAVDQIPKEDIARYTAESLLDDLVARYALEVPVLGEPVAEPPEDSRVDVTRDVSYSSLDGRPIHAPATKLVVVIPFEGCSDILKCRPSSYSSIFPHATVRDHEIRITLVYTKAEQDEVTRVLQRQQTLLRSYLDKATPQVESFNASLSARAGARLATRRQSLESGEGLLETLQIPIRRAKQESVLAVPLVRRQLVLRPTGASETEYTVDPAEYGHIVDLCERMSLAIEKSPATFAHMDEEQIRDFFLVMLNSHYDGLATGETFHGAGHTDILISYHSRSSFIAECKVWHGATQLSAAIDQLQTYTCWRDTKAAVLIFSRNKDFTDVCEKIPAAIRAHPNYISESDDARETVWRFVFRHGDDYARKIDVAVLAFNIPSASDPEDDNSQA